MRAQRATPPAGSRQPWSRLDTVVSVGLVVIGWLVAAAVLGSAQFTMMFLDDCHQPACHVPRAVHVYLAGIAVSVVTAYVTAHWAMRATDRRRWPRALLALAVSLWCAVATLFVLYVALDVHPEYFQEQQLR